MWQHSLNRKQEGGSRCIGDFYPARIGCFSPTRSGCFNPALTKKRVVITLQGFGSRLPAVFTDEIIRKFVNAKIQFTCDGPVFGINYGKS